MSNEPTTRQHHEGIKVSQRMPRQSFTVRLPGDVYWNDWQELHGFVSCYTPDNAPVSNSIMARLGVWALKRLQREAEQTGPDSVNELGEELARVAQTAATRKRGPDKASVSRVYNTGTRR